MGVFDKLDKQVKTLDEQANHVAINCFLMWWYNTWDRNNNQDNFYDKQVFKKGNVVIFGQKYQKRRPEIGVVVRTTAKKVVIQTGPLKLDGRPKFEGMTTNIKYCSETVLKTNVLKISDNVGDFCKLIGLNISDIVNSL